MFFRVGILTFVLGMAPLANAKEWNLQARYRASAFRTNTLDQTGTFHHQPSRWLKASYGLRLEQTTLDLNAVSYAVSLQSPLTYFFEPIVQLAHLNHLQDGITTTQVQLRAKLQSPKLWFLRLFGSFGWYKRWTRLRNPLLTPVIFHADFSDQNLVVQLGFNASLSPSLATTFSIATFDAMETFNLNNPFFRLAVRYSPLNSKFHYELFSRYKVMLGFGRLEELAMGLGLGWRL